MKSSFRRIIAIVISLWMMASLFTVSFGAMAEITPVKAWNAREVGSNAVGRFRYNYLMKEAIVGMRTYGCPEYIPDDPRTHPAIAQWARADIMTGPLEEGILEVGDEIRFGGFFEYANDMDDEATAGFTIQYFDAANVQQVFGIGVRLSAAAFSEVEEQIDDTYGFAYRDVFENYVVADAEEAEDVTASGMKILIGDFNGLHYDVSPQTIYGFYVYNVTQDRYIFQKNGAELLTMGWSGCDAYQETVTVEYADTDNMTGLSFLSSDYEQTLFKAPLSVEKATAGAYRVHCSGLEITGEGDVTVDFGVVVNDVFVPVASQTITQENENAMFDVTEAMAAYPIGFSVRQAADVSITTSGMELYRDGDLDADLDTTDADAALTASTAIARVTVDDTATVEAARAAYNALTDGQKALVRNLGVLEAAEQALVKIAEDQAAADAVVELIDALPEVITAEDAEAITTARTALDALTDAQKALVSNVTVLEAAEDAFANLPGEPDVMYGDVNGDEDVNASDALECLQHSVKLKTLEGDAFTAADVDLNGDINASDALYILQFSVQLILELPVQG